MTLTLGKPVVLKCKCGGEPMMQINVLQEYYFVCQSCNNASDARNCDDQMKALDRWNTMQVEPTYQDFTDALEQGFGVTPDHVTSLNTVRAAREQDGSKWTPRDALVETIRMIDAGEIKPTVTIVSYLDHDGRVGYVQSSPRAFDMIGVLSRVLHKIHRMLDHD